MASQIRAAKPSPKKNPTVTDGIFSDFGFSGYFNSLSLLDMQYSTISFMCLNRLLKKRINVILLILFLTREQINVECFIVTNQLSTSH